jgi:hypothetical protein
MIKTVHAALRRSDTLVEDTLGCLALALLLIAGLYLPVIF